MALSAADAVDAVRSILAGPREFEARRLDVIAAALRPMTPTVAMPARATSILKDLASKSQTNYLPLVLDSTSQVMKVEGYRGAGSDSNARPWEVWQRNGMDARQTGVHRAALAYGASYTTVLPGRVAGADFPVIEGFSPRQMTAVYQNPARDEWPMLALDVQGKMLRLFDEECVYYIGAENAPRSGFASYGPFGALSGKLDFIERRTHGLGVCPVVRFRDRMLLEGEEQYGIIEPLITLQRRLDETTFGMLVTQFFAAFKQKYVIGWTPQSEEERLVAGAAEFWTFADLPSEVQLGELSASEPDGYLRSKESVIQDMSAIGQVPPTSLGVTSVSNISAEALAAFQDSSDKKTDEITTSFGESHEQGFRLAALIQGDSEAANDFSAQCRWKDATARSLAQMTDALVKQVAGLGMPAEFALSKLPGITEQDLQLMTRMRAEERRQAQEDAALAVEPPPAPAVAVESLPAL